MSNELLEAVPHWSGPLWRSKRCHSDQQPVPRTRLLSADERCQDPHYMAYWLSTFQHLQLKNAVKIAFPVDICLPLDLAFGI